MKKLVYVLGPDICRADVGELVLDTGGTFTIFL